ncbi:MAG TPA: PIN domain-containing protein [Haliscomenobacter sp.]|uniref:PIN domain-containing protein n=1 Tax=Haliscomenobacter sp. TaxID=2717303 RepID=UPI002BF1C8EC|nr:PIN domain-containing protein [Haliscomenobacter sp.]HOY20098.1 PIN domain-containing protein [Haliscomenobacter sp.]
MIYSPRFTVILDACVLYPAPIRDILLNLADLDIYSPKWSEIIQEEWIRNLLENRPDLSKLKLRRTVQAMNAAFPDAEVHSFEELIDLLELPDLGDRHVLAACIKCKADAIITFNTKDFPREKLDQYNIEVYTPDKFIHLLHELDSSIVKQAFDNQLASLKSPPVSKEKLISILERCGLRNASNFFT